MKGLLIHVGDDLNPGVFNGTGYALHLLPDHPDPDLEHFTYGDWTHRTHAFSDLKRGDNVFFNFKFNDGKWYITAFFHLSEVLDGADIVAVQNRSPYQFNAHVIRGDLNYQESLSDFRMLIGNPRTSQTHMTVPVPVDESFWKKLDLRDKDGVSFTKRLKERKHRFGKYTVMQINGSFLRMPKPLNERQTLAVLRLILIANRPNLGPTKSRYVEPTHQSSVR